MGIFSWKATTKNGFGKYCVNNNACIMTDFYKPNLKGGHRHNHIRNAHKRMEKRMHKCHSCGELFPKGIRHFVCNSCVEEAKIKAALDMYEKFNGIIRNQ